MFINPSLVFQLFIYFILPLAINTKEMLPNYLLVVCSCCLCSLVAFRCICGFRGVTVGIKAGIRFSEKVRFNMKHLHM
jgi:hypothetical protein